MLLQQIEKYMRRTGVSATRFGREVARDPRLVHDLRNGREIREAMANRVRDYLHGHAA
jgi:2,4-dienoyl-CoA reductase-like NADH-dependent reductase (Old Yellow Enzyme family)